VITEFPDLAAAAADGDLEAWATLAGVIAAVVFLGRAALKHRKYKKARAANDRLRRRSALPTANQAGIRAHLKGLERGRSPGSTRVVGSEAELKSLFDRWSAGGTPAVAKGYKGPYVKLPDGTGVGLRATSRSGGPTIDIKFPDGTNMKVHIK
jgi:hypothetical protein